MNEEIIDDGDLKYKIDFSNSQKTGFYFDQTDNRKFIEKFVKDKSALDAFCNSGGFGLHAAYAGASRITIVDSSATEIENAKYNFELNGLKSETEFVISDIFDFLESLISQFHCAAIAPDNGRMQYVHVFVNENQPVHLIRYADCLYVF